MLAKNLLNVLLRNAYCSKSSTIVRNFSVTYVNGESVKIQSTDDFKQKVINSKVPVVVDFFATYVFIYIILSLELSSISCGQIQ